MSLLEAIEITPTNKNFTVATISCRISKLQQIDGWMSRLNTYVSIIRARVNEQDTILQKSVVIRMHRKSCLMPVLGEVFNRSYHMLCTFGSYRPTPGDLVCSKKVCFTFFFCAYFEGMAFSDIFW